MIEALNNLLSSLDNLLDKIETTVKTYRKKTKLSDSDRRLQIAIKTAQEIISTYDAVQRGIAIAMQHEREKTGAIALQLKMTDGWENRNPYRPKYKYWTDFSPDVAIEVLRTLNQNYSHAIAHLIEKLEVIVRPFRAHQPEQVQVRSLGLRPYKFSSYANWVQSFSDHQMSYALWRECGFE